MPGTSKVKVAPIHCGQGVTSLFQKWYLAPQLDQKYGKKQTVLIFGVRHPIWAPNIVPHRSAAGYSGNHKKLFKRGVVMASTVYSFGLSGIEGHIVEVETETILGVNSVSIVGLGDKAVKEAKERLEAAITHSGFAFPFQKVVFNLAPSDMKKTGTHYDLAMAIGLLIRTEQLRSSNLDKIGFIGELSLNAFVRPVSGVLPMVLKAKEIGLKKIILPMENVREGSLVSGIEICGCETLLEVTEILSGKTHPPKKPQIYTPKPFEPINDFTDVKGHGHLIEYIAIAAAGGHNLLMIGPPGCGKSMIAKRIPSILPEMSEEESLEVTKIYSVANMLKEKGTLIKNRPFRAPHHNASTNSLIGGGSFAKPGEISLAHHGVLFLDEISEFSKKTLESLRQPLEDKSVTITRVWGSNTYPANFMLVGAMNPCPCGYFGQNKCRCTDYEIAKYRNKLSGPILDRMDIQKYVEPVDFFEKEHRSIDSNDLRKRVIKARQIQEKRYKNFPAINCNAQLPPALLDEFCKLDSESKALLRTANERFRFSGRSLHKFIKVARTIADIEGEAKIHVHHMRKSIFSRDLDKENLWSE